MLSLVSCDTEFGLYQCNRKLLKVLNRAGALTQFNLYFFFKLSVCLFMAAAGLPCCAWAFSSCDAGFSLWGLLLFQSKGSRAQ